MTTLGVALCDARGPLNDLMDKMSGEEGERWLRALKGMLRKENPWESVTLWEWKTIQLGTQSFPGLKMAILKALTEHASVMLTQTPFSQHRKEIHLMSVLGKDLGQEGDETLAEIYHRADKNKLDLCPPEVGPQLRRQYTDQPSGDALLIGMEPIKSHDGSNRIFEVLNHPTQGVLLASVEVSEPCDYSPSIRWIFRSRRS